MTTDTTKTINPETLDQTLPNIALLLNHFFAQGVKLHGFCDMLEQENLQQALHTFLRVYNMVGASCSKLFKEFQAGNDETVEPMINVLEDINGFVTLRKLFDEVLTQYTVMPGSENTDSHTYL